MCTLDGSTAVQTHHLLSGVHVGISPDQIDQKQNEKDDCKTHRKNALEIDEGDNDNDGMYI